MTPTALALVVAAAIVHAAWNALAKRSRDQVAFIWSANTLATLLLAPAWGAMLVAGGLPPGAVPFVIATILLHAFYFYALGTSYRWGDLSLVYPVARGLGVALVPVLALPLFGERLSPLGVAGIALVVAGIVVLHLGPGGPAPPSLPERLRRPGTWWAVLTGLTIASYSLVDKAGVARLHPVPYIGLLGLGSSLLLLPVILPRRDVLGREWATNRRSLLIASTLILTSYLLVLFAFRLAKTGYVVAARELSIVFSALIGSLWLGEGGLRARLLGAAVILAGVACVALAR